LRTKSFLDHANIGGAIFGKTIDDYSMLKYIDTATLRAFKAHL